MAENKKPLHAVVMEPPTRSDDFESEEPTPPVPFDGPGTYIAHALREANKINRKTADIHSQMKNIQGESRDVMIGMRDVLVEVRDVLIEVRDELVHMRKRRENGSGH